MMLVFTAPNEWEESSVSSLLSPLTLTLTLALHLHFALLPCPALLPAGSARQVADREIPIVHRILKVHEKVSGEVDVLTKGDNNAVDDRGLYAAGQSWINKQHVIGRAKGSPRDAAPLLVTPLPPHLARIGISFCRLPPVHRHGHYHHERLPARQVCPGWHHGALCAHDERMTPAGVRRRAAPLVRGWHDRRLAAGWAHSTPEHVTRDTAPTGDARPCVGVGRVLWCTYYRGLGGHNSAVSRSDTTPFWFSAHLAPFSPGEFT